MRTAPSLLALLRTPLLPLGTQLSQPDPSMPLILAQILHPLAGLTRLPLQFGLHRQKRLTLPIKGE